MHSLYKGLIIPLALPWYTFAVWHVYWANWLCINDYLNKRIWVYKQNYTLISFYIIYTHINNKLNAFYGDMIWTHFIMQIYIIFENKTSGPLFPYSIIGWGVFFLEKFKFKVFFRLKSTIHCLDHLSNCQGPMLENLLPQQYPDLQ